MLALILMGPCQPGFPSCWVAMLSCSTWVMVVNMNIKDEHALT
jgi:hypothetical protein